MYLREDFTLLVDCSHNMDPKQIICINLRYAHYIDQRKFKEIVIQKANTLFVHALAGLITHLFLDGF